MKRLDFENYFLCYIAYQKLRYINSQQDQIMGPMCGPDIGPIEFLKWISGFFRKRESSSYPNTIVKGWTFP